MELRIVKAHYRKGTYCLRCGALKVDVKKYKEKCGLYGTNYKKHIYK